MKVAFRSDGLEVEGSRVLWTTDAVLRGVGQVMLQNNAYTGALFVAGAFVASLTGALAMLAGTIVSTLTAMLLGADRDEVHDGLFGFNGALVGIALAVFFRVDASFCAYVVIGAAFSTVVTAALSNLLRPSSLPGLTAPFVLVTWGFVAAHAQLPGLRPTEALLSVRAAQASAPEALNFATISEGPLRGVAQVFLQNELATGVLFVVGLLVASRAATAAALFGSIAGLLVAWGFGAPDTALRNGLFGYNAALTAIALAAFFAPSRSAASYSIGAIVVTTVASGAVAAALAPLGVPSLTAPFVIVVWAFVLAAPAFPPLRRVGEAPEGEESAPTPATPGGAEAS